MKYQALLFLIWTFSSMQLYAQISWQPTNGPYAGSVLSIQEDQSGNFYAGTWLGGVYRLQAGDSVWTHLDEKLNFGGIWDFDVSDEQVIYAASNAGIYQSMDQGNNWVLGWEGLTSSFCRSVAIYSADTIFAGTNNKGVFRSVDGGLTWEEKTDGIGSERIWTLLMSDSGEIYAGTNTKGVFRSDDVGESWTALNTGLTNLQINDLILSNSDFLFAATFAGVFRSKDQGLSWELVHSRSACWSLEEDAEGNIYAGFQGLHVISGDEGDNWQEVYTDKFGDIISDLCYTSEGKMLAGTGGSGVFESDDLGNNWEGKNNGLSNINIRSHVKNSRGSLFIGAVNGLFRSDDLGESWTELANGLISTNIENMTITQNDILFVGTNASGLQYSTDDGENWLVPNSGLDNRFIRAIGEAPNGDIYAGASDGELYKSTDVGKNWQLLDAGFPSDEINVIGTNSEGHIFVGILSRGVYRSTDSGNSWMAISNGLQESYRPQSFLFLPNQEVWVGGFSGVFRSTDNGDSWSSTNMGFQVYTLAMDSAGNKFAGTRGQGSYQLLMGEEDWRRENEGLKHLSITSLSLHADSVIFAGTQGGGFYKGLITSPSVGIDHEPILEGLELSTNVPNPFRQRTSFQYNLPYAAQVSLKIYDLLGQQVAVVLNQKSQHAGLHSAFWDVEDRIPSGVYVYTLFFDQYKLSKRLLILK